MREGATDETLGAKAYTGRGPCKASEIILLCAMKDKVLRMILLQDGKNNCPGMILLHKKVGEGPAFCAIRGANYQRNGPYCPVGRGRIDMQ